MNITTILDGNTSQFRSWFAGMMKISTDNHNLYFSTLPKPTFTFTVGSRYIRVMRDNSAHAFIDRTNGDVLKPASWKAPAKHSRGNIFDNCNGLTQMGSYGPAYLK